MTHQVEIEQIVKQWGIDLDGFAPSEQVMVMPEYSDVITLATRSHEAGAASREPRIKVLEELNDKWAAMYEEGTKEYIQILSENAALKARIDELEAKLQERTTLHGVFVAEAYEREVERVQAKLDRVVEGLQQFGLEANWWEKSDGDICWVGEPNPIAYAQSILREIAEPQQGQTSDAPSQSSN